MRTVDILYLISMVICTTTVLTLLCLGLICLLYYIEQSKGAIDRAFIGATDWLLNRVFGCDGRKPRGK